MRLSHLVTSAAAMALVAMPAQAMAQEAPHPEPEAPSGDACGDRDVVATYAAPAGQESSTVDEAFGKVSFGQELLGTARTVSWDARDDLDFSKVVVQVGSRQVVASSDLEGQLTVPGASRAMSITFCAAEASPTPTPVPPGPVDAVDEEPDVLGVVISAPAPQPAPEPAPEPVPQPAPAQPAPAQPAPAQPAPAQPAPAQPEPAQPAPQPAPAQPAPPPPFIAVRPPVTEPAPAPPTVPPATGEPVDLEDDTTSDPLSREPEVGLEPVERPEPVDGPDPDDEVESEADQQAEPSPVPTPVAIDVIQPDEDEAEDSPDFDAYVAGLLAWVPTTEDEPEDSSEESAEEGDEAWAPAPRRSIDLGPAANEAPEPHFVNAESGMPEREPVPRLLEVDFADGDHSSWAGKTSSEVQEPEVLVLVIGDDETTADDQRPPTRAKERTGLRQRLADGTEVARAAMFGQITIGGSSGQIRPGDVSFA